MKRHTWWSAVPLALACFLGAPAAQAVELLQNGSLDTTVSPPSWTQTETITGMPGAPISMSEQISFANSPNDPNGTGLGIFIKPRSGNTDAYEGQNKMINFGLSQTVTGFAG